MAEKFQEHVSNLWDGGLTVFGMSLGEELGLFKAMSDLGHPCSSEELAKTVGCKERYILEWLRSMACAKILDYDADKDLYYITEEKIPCLTNFGYIPIGLYTHFGQRHNLLKNCFKLEGPPGYDQASFPEAGIWLDSYRAGLFGDVLDNQLLADIPNLKQRLESGIKVADVGCGAGLMALLIAERFPNSTVYGLDIDENMLAHGTERAKERNLKNLRYELADVHKFSESWAGHFDHVFIYDVLHDMPYPAVALKEIYKCLKEGGVFSMFEPSMHSALKDNIRDNLPGSNYLMSLYWCMPHSLSAPGGESWGRSLGEEKGTEFLKLAGFKDFSVIHRDMNHFICTK